MTARIQMLIDDRCHVVFADCSGIGNASTYRQILARLDPCLRRGGYDYLVDCREARLTAGGVGGEAVAGHLEAWREQLHGHRGALVVGDEIDAGHGRTIAGSLTSLGFELRVFRDRGCAEKWVITGS